MDFNYDKYEAYCEQANARAKGFFAGEFLPVCHVWYGQAFDKYSRYREESLEKQLEAITKTIETSNDWVPFLEPWHGVGVFAEAFGCPFEWRDVDAPWTHPIIDSIEKLKRLERPSLEKAVMLKYVLDTTEYFAEKTKGRIPIAATDVQSPLDTLSLIADTSFLFRETWDYPEEFHRVLSDITDLIIEFTKKQRACCPKTARPGHGFWSPSIMDGIGVSDDVMVMISPDFYAEFGKPYNERIAKELGGIGIHSCGSWKHNFNSAINTKGVRMIDLAMSKSWDPGPNSPSDVISAFSGSPIPLHARLGYEDKDAIRKLLEADILKVLLFPWHDDPAERQRRYDDVKSMQGNIWRKTRP
jgi:hypothetical protein